MEKHKDFVGFQEPYKTAPLYARVAIRCNEVHAFFGDISREIMLEPSIFLIGPPKVSSNSNPQYKKYAPIIRPAAVTTGFRSGKTTTYLSSAARSPNHRATAAAVERRGATRR